MHVEEHLDLTAFAVNLKLSAFRMPYNMLHGLDCIHFSQILVRDTKSNHSKSKPKTSYKTLNPKPSHYCPFIYSKCCRLLGA
jgi:hypothetical protein